MAELFKGGSGQVSASAGVPVEVPADERLEKDLTDRQQMAFDAERFHAGELGRARRVREACEAGLARLQMGDPEQSSEVPVDFGVPERPLPAGS